MRGWALVLCLAGLAPAQEGGRDPGAGAPPIVFLRWERIRHRGEIFETAWRTLEAHVDLPPRLRLFDLDGDPKRGETIRKRVPRPYLVLALDDGSALQAKKLWPRAPLLKVGDAEDAQLSSRAQRRRLVELFELFRPGLRKVAVFGEVPDRKAFSHLTFVPCREAADAQGCGLAWVTETHGAAAKKLRPRLDAMGIPLATTSDRVPLGVAALQVLPDPRAVGRKVAALILSRVRRTLPPVRFAAGFHVRLDLRASEAAGHRVPLRALAHADVVRRRKRP